MFVPWCFFVVLSQGEHRAGLREGFGKLSLANGDKYVGAFHNNLQHGRGVYTWAKGDVYDGSWSDVRMHGIGKYSWPDGIVYLGQDCSMAVAIPLCVMRHF